MPAGSEFLDVIAPQYIGDLIVFMEKGSRSARVSDLDVRTLLAYSGHMARRKGRHAILPRSMVREARALPILTATPQAGVSAG